MAESELYDYNRWYFAAGTTPSYLSKSRTLGAIQRGGAHVQNVSDSCGIPDRVDGRLIYEGATTRGANIRSDAYCTENDFTSVVDFGDLPAAFNGFTCSWAYVADGPNRVATADIRLNRVEKRWTTSVTRSCRGRFDVESTITHERGHHFGLGEVSESGHGNLTMSAISNGPCQISERSLGRGDAIGLNAKESGGVRGPRPRTPPLSTYDATRLTGISQRD